MKYRSVFDIIGPVMIGPSSSHTAGAARIGRAARRLFGRKPDRVMVTLYGSFAKTYRGHGTDIALIGGVLDFDTFDKRIVKSLEIAREQGIRSGVPGIGGGARASQHGSAPPGRRAGSDGGGRRFHRGRQDGNRGVERFRTEDDRQLPDPARSAPGSLRSDCRRRRRSLPGIGSTSGICRSPARKRGLKP